MDWNLFLLVSVLSAIHTTEAQGCSPSLGDIQAGEISYRGALDSDTCTWTFPNVNGDNYVLALYLKQISMIRYFSILSDSACLGHLYLPDFEGRYCERRPHCRVYKTNRNNKCRFEVLSTNLRDVSEECSNNTAIFTGPTLPTELKFEAIYTSSKSFSFDYKYIECSTQAIESTTRTINATAVTMTYHLQTNTAVGFTAGIVILVILLVAACSAVIYLLYSKKMNAGRSNLVADEQAADVNQSQVRNGATAGNQVSYVNQRNSGVRADSHEYASASYDTVNPYATVQGEIVYNEVYRMTDD